jgi:tRNA A-37 threonylcarbamoyl transferase component Bud32/tetratricopeptide (TPR) repeat protein
MADESRVQQLLDEICDSGCTPEEVCGDCPDLLPEVRRRLRQLHALKAELDALFPTSESGGDRPRIPGYEVEALLGRGGMGVVYKARQLRLNRPVALKMLLAGAYAGPHERARFQREAEAVAGLRHPNIVQVYDVGEHEGWPYFTMEFVEGGSLAHALAGAPQPARQAAALVGTLAEAVHAAHQGGIVHRDLKPANILLTADNTPKVADFGLARHFDGEPALTLSGARMGTPSYMAPEQTGGSSLAIGPAVDIYALGAILYELLTGRAPFRGATELETLESINTTEPVPPSRLVPTVPRDAETITLKCLLKEPARRYESAQALAEDLRRFLADEPILARPVGWTERAWRWSRRWYRRNKAVAQAISGVFLVLAAGTVLSSYRAMRAAREGAHARARATFIERLSGDRTFTLGELVSMHSKVDPLIASADPHERAQLLSLRGHLNGRRGHWSQAADDFGAAVEIIPDDHLSWYRGAVLRAWLGDRDGYSRLCRELFGRFSREEDPTINERVAKACLLLPLPARELERACQLIDEAGIKAEHHWGRPWVEATQSLAHYRRGRENEALSLADHSLTFGASDWNRTLVAHAVRAMALRRLGRDEEARQALQSAGQTTRRIKGLGGGDYTDNWHDYLIGNLLLREANALQADPAEVRP